MDSSKIISLEDFARNQNRFPAEEEALDYALKICGLLAECDGKYPLLSPKNIYIENDVRWVTVRQSVTESAPEAVFRAGSVLHHLVTRAPFRISYFLDGPPPSRERNPQISVRFEAIISRMLQNQGALRYATVAELTDDLQRLQKELTGDWPIRWACFKGTGTRTSAVSLADWDPTGQTLKEVWKAAIGDVWASPVIAGESLFVGSGDGNFYSIDAETGKIVWKLALGARIESTACLHRNTAYVGSDMGTLHAVNLRNGQVLWKKTLSEYVRSSPFCDGERVYVGSISPEKKSGMLWALDVQNGSVAWRKSMGPVFSSPVVEQGEIYIGSDDETFYSLNTDGSVRWQTALAGKIRSTAALVRDFLYVGGFGGVFYKIRRSTGEVVWRNEEAGSMYSSPAAGKGFVCAGNNSGVASIFQVNGGKIKGTFATGGPLTATPLVVNQFVLLGSNDGRFYVLDSSAKALCSFDSRAPINSSPCFLNGRIYFGSDQGLHALSL